MPVTAEGGALPEGEYAEQAFEVRSVGGLSGCVWIARDSGGGPWSWSLFWW